MASLQQHGRPVEDVIQALTDKRVNDVKWADGRAFGMVHDGGPSVHEVAEQAARLYLHENALNTKAFPSLGQIQSEVVGWTAGLLHGDDDVAGFLTSGGTESILCGVLAARACVFERGITAPEMVVAESAHAAFHKAAHTFGITLHKTPVKDDWTADVDAIGRAVQRQHRAGGRFGAPVPAGGAGRHPGDCGTGIVDRLQLSRRRLHGRLRAAPSPRCRTAGEAVHSRLDGAHHHPGLYLHALGPTRRVGDPTHQVVIGQDQTFVFDDWLGGFYASPNMQGTRSGLPMACAWAVMSHLGIDGYVDLTRQVLENAEPSSGAGVAAIDGIRVLGDGRFHLVAVASDPSSEAEVDIFALGDALLAKGWFHDRQGPPDSLHSTISNSNTGVIDDYLSDLAECVAGVVGNGTDDRSTNYATLE